MDQIALVDFDNIFLLIFNPNLFGVFKQFLPTLGQLLVETLIFPVVENFVHLCSLHINETDIHATN